MAVDTFVNATEQLTGTQKTQPIETMKINGVEDIATNYDVILFSAENTLIKNGMVNPAGAVTVLALRKMNIKLAIFSLDETTTKEDLTTQVNHLGLSFTQERILHIDELEKIEDQFPFIPSSRILMVCSDVINEIAYGCAHGLNTHLITGSAEDKSEHLGISPHYISMSV